MDESTTRYLWTGVDNLVARFAGALYFGTKLAAAASTVKPLLGGRLGEAMRRTTVEQSGMGPAVLALLIVGAFALAGCSSPPDTPATSPPVSASAASEAATTTAPVPVTPAVYKPATDQGPAENVPFPVLPEKAKEFSREGLIAFTEYWYSTLGYAFETGDPGPMMAVSDPGCRTCNAMKQATVAGHAGGKWISGGKMTVEQPSSDFAKTPDGSYQAITMARQEQVKYFKKDKSLSKDLGVTTAQGDILVGSYIEGHWKAITVQHLAGSSGS